MWSKFLGIVPCLEMLLFKSCPSGYKEEHKLLFIYFNDHKMFCPNTSVLPHFLFLFFFYFLNQKYNMTKKPSNQPKNKPKNFQVALLNIFRWTDDMLILLRQNAKFIYWKGEGFPKSTMWNQEHIHATCVDYLILIWKVAGPSQGQSWRCLKTLMIYDI